MRELYKCSTVRFQRTSHPKKDVRARATLWTLHMAPPVSPHFHSLMLHQNMLYSGSVSSSLCGWQKKKKNPTACASYGDRAPWTGRLLCPLSLLPCKLDQTSRGRKNDILSGLWWQRAFNTAAKNTQGTKGWNKLPWTAKRSKALISFNNHSREPKQLCMSKIWWVIIFWMPLT